MIGAYQGVIDATIVLIASLSVARAIQYVTGFYEVPVLLSQDEHA
jgi:hypothetical protein